LTLARIALAPAILAVLAGGALTDDSPSEPALWTAPAAGLLALAALFDWLDGLLARALRAESAFGRFWDPVADKLVIAAALIGGAFAMPTPLFIAPAVMLLGRDALVTWLRTRPAHAAATARPSILAKWKTALEYAALVMLFSSALAARGAAALFGDSAARSVQTDIALGGLGALWLATVLSLWTGWDYFRIARGGDGP
jgi:CDP-diacylglycerol--glycerol-3-phosphate 3-phosphatidyltransferase